MKSPFATLLLLAGLSGMAFSTAALSDQAEADCQVRAHGDAKPKQSGPCSFSQRQGYIDIRLNNGKTYNLSPTGEANTFRDQDGQHVRRVEADGNMHKYKWDNRNITVYFNGGNSSSNEQQGHLGSGYDSSGSDAWFTRLVGAASDGAESQLDINGFRQVDSFDSGRDGHGTVWYNNSSRQCLQMITVNGRVDSAVDIQTHPRCRH